MSDLELMQAITVVGIAEAFVTSIVSGAFLAGAKNRTNGFGFGKRIRATVSSTSSRIARM
jgi:hypothetical protein